MLFSPLLVCRIMGNLIVHSCGRVYVSNELSSIVMI